MKVSNRALGRFEKYFSPMVRFPMTDLSKFSDEERSVLMVLIHIPEISNEIKSHYCTESCLLCSLSQILINIDNLALNNSRNFVNYQSFDLPLMQDFRSAFVSKLSSILYFCHFSIKPHKSSACPSHTHLIEPMVKVTCECGRIWGKSISKGFVCQVPVDQMVLPESPDKDFFHLFEPKKGIARKVVRLGKRSVLLGSNQKFCENFKKVLGNIEARQGSCGLEGCKRRKTRIRFGEKAGYLIFGLEYKPSDVLLFNSMQIFCQLQNPIRLSELDEKCALELYVNLIVLTDFKRLYVCKVKDMRWFELTENSLILIGKGSWADLILFALKSQLYPLLIIYTPIPSPPLNLSKFQRILLESLSYSIDFFGENESIVSDLFYNINSFFADRLEIIKQCKFCNKSKKIFEKCECGYIEADWICEFCGYFNFDKCKVCTGCHMARILSSEDFSCDRCSKISYSVNSCLFCPLTVCCKCNNQLHAFISIFCMNCNMNTIGKSKCNRSNHKFECNQCQN